MGREVRERLAWWSLEGAAGLFCPEMWSPSCLKLQNGGFLGAARSEGGLKGWMDEGWDAERGKMED